MNRVLRLLAALGLVIGATIGLAGTAAATPIPPADCADDGFGYVPGGACELAVEVTPVCDNDVPLLSYRAQLDGTAASGLTITWINPDGEDVVLTDQPMEGVVRWPGATVDGNGNPTDWPGYTLLDSGEWVEGDEYDWTRPSVQVSFAANPDALATVSYPQATALCTPGPTGGASSSGVSQVSNPASEGGVLSQALLAETGMTLVPVVGAAGGLVLGGLVVLALGRGRRRAATED